jgi:hypothetical protein
MAIQTINIGNIANDGTGDDLRVAFQKVNSNFVDLNQRVAPQLDGENLGSGEGVFYVKDSDIFKFKSLVAGPELAVSSTADEITISAGTNFGNLIFNADVGNTTVRANNEAIFLTGGDNIDTTATSQRVTFNINGTNLVVKDTSPTLGGNLDADGNDISNGGTVTANKFVGDLEGNVWGADLRFYIQGLRGAITGTDLGTVNENATTGFEMLLFGATIDYGTITSPTALKSDFGSFVTPL